MRYSTTIGLVLALTCLSGTSPTVQGNIDITCDTLKGNQIDWDCVLGPNSLEEVYDRGGTFTTCEDNTPHHPCSRFIVKKDAERSEVKVKEGPDGFPFLKDEKYIFKYSFRAIEGMQVGSRFTILGQIKGSKEGNMFKGVPIYSLTANEYGLMVRFSNLASIEDFYPGLDQYLSWEDATGEWVHVKITTVFGKSMEVEISGAVEGKAVWPQHLKPVAWHEDAEMARLKLGLYHSTENVADGEVEYRDISIEGPNGIIRTSAEEGDDEDNVDGGEDGDGQRRRDIEVDSDYSADPCMTSEKCEAIDITCDALTGNQIDWDCIFGPGALEEVYRNGGIFTTFIVKKEAERSEVKVKQGPDGFPFLKDEKYIFKYSFRAVDDMKVAKRFTHLGQLKGSKGGYMIKGDPIYSLTANTDGLMVRFSNLESIEDFHPGLEKHLNWNDATGQWVHVKITTVFGTSMKVEISGAVEGTAVWPENLKPIAWHRDSEMVRMKLGLYHKTDEVYDGEVEYRDISIKGPNGIIRTSPPRGTMGSLYLGCYRDVAGDHVLNRAKIINADMTTEMCADFCQGAHFFGTQHSTECWCGDYNSDIGQHGSSDQCNMDCPGISGILKCGGKYALSIYQYDASPKHIPEGSKYLGCFVDVPSDRALPRERTSDESSMTYEFCKNFCGKAMYFGVQHGSECFCGHASDDYSKHGVTTCSMPCTGASDTVCGDGDAINVFQRT